MHNVKAYFTEGGCVYGNTEDSNAQQPPFARDVWENNLMPKTHGRDEAVY